MTSAADFLAVMNSKQNDGAAAMKHPPAPKAPPTTFDLERERVRRALDSTPAKPVCESPIEQKLLDAFLLLGFTRGTTGYVHTASPAVLLEPQYEVPGYRVDFSLSTGRIWIAVEADGHEWHEKTREQAQRDKARDRALVAHIFSGVLRFTGSEINADAMACADEALRVCRAVHARLDT